MIDQLELKDSTRFEDSTSQAQIGFRRGRIAARMVVHQDKSVGAEHDYRLKDFPWMGEGLNKLLRRTVKSLPNLACSRYI